MTQLRRIIFLDLDDVVCLNQRAFDLFDVWPSARGDDDVFRHVFSDAALLGLQELLTIEQTAVVISSSWRLSFDLDAISEVLSRCGAGFLPPAFHFDWKTEHLDDRLVEIRTWLKRHRQDVESWVAIDDAISGATLAAFIATHPDSPDAQRYVLCNPAVGLTRFDANRARLALLTPWRPSKRQS